MKRRDFIKNASCLLGGALASISGFVSAALPGATVPQTKGLTLEKLRQYRDELEKAEAKYLKRSGTRFIAVLPETPIRMRPVTDKDRENYCRAHTGCQCAFRREAANRDMVPECMIDSWKETPCKEDSGDWNPFDYYAQQVRLRAGAIPSRYEHTHVPTIEEVQGAED